jgi:hypothetical protein
MSHAQAAQLAEKSRNGLQAFFQTYFWVVVALGIGFVGFIGWLYYSDWRKNRGYRRYIESKRRKPV